MSKLKFDMHTDRLTDQGCVLQGFLSLTRNSRWPLLEVDETYRFSTLGSAVIQLQKNLKRPAPLTSMQTTEGLERLSAFCGTV